MRGVRPSAPALQGMEPYDPKYLPADVFMSANESALDLPDAVRDAICTRMRSFEFNRYPDPLANGLRDELAACYGLGRDSVLLGNGGDELLFDIELAWGGPGRTLLNFPPTFSVYEANALLTGTKVVNIERVGHDFEVDRDAALARLALDDIDLVIVTSPNNPTGSACSLETITAICEATDALVLADEAYGEFSDTTALPALADHENLLILHTFSKAYRAAGVRLGYFLGAPSVIEELEKVRQPYSVDALSQLVGTEIVRARELFAPGIQDVIEQRGKLEAALAMQPGVEVFASQANYVMFRVDDADGVWQRLYDEYSILVRNWSHNPLLPGCLRVTVCTAEENTRFLAALGEILSA